MAWASEQLGTVFRDPCEAFGIVNRNGHLIGAIILNDYDARNIELTIVGPNSLGKQTAQEVFTVIFNDLDCRRVSLTVPSKNKDIIAKAMRWGWAVEGLKRDYYDEDHAVILGMTRDECRFLRD